MTQQENKNYTFGVTVSLEDGQTQTIRVAGTPADPHFFGKDICDILQLENPKDAIQKLVSNKHKKELKSLLEEQNKGVIVPFEVGCLKHTTPLGSFNLSTLKHNNGRAVVLSEPGVEQLLNGTKKDKNKKILRNSINRWLWTTKYESNAGLVDIFSFISGTALATSLTSDWFQDLWYPLSKVRGSLGATPEREEKRPIIITQNLLEWMGYKGDKESFKQLSFSRLLDSLKLKYTEIDHKHPLAIEYPCVQNECKQLMLSNNHEKKKWICIEPRSFKKVVMRLNTENGEMVRDYYLNLEEAMFAYGEYTHRFLVDKMQREARLRDLELSEAMTQLTIKESQLAIKDREEEELKEQLAIKEQKLEEEKEARVKAERKAIRVNKFMRRVTIKEKKIEWIYIATTKMYAGERLFKVGSTTRLSSRIGGYNTGRPREDTYYYCWVKKCYNAKDLDYHIQKLLVEFKHRENAELYCGIKYSDLKDIVNFIVDNYDESIDYINNFIRTRLNESLEEEDEEPPRLDYKRITYQIGEHTETIDLEKEDADVIRDELENILCSVKEQNERDDIVVVDRKELIERLAKVTNLGKKELWLQIKEYTGWTSSKKEIDDGLFKYKITY
ncbi:BRO-like protein [Chloriridovirus anopheles1]|uniref:BRO-like protein n=1 Tax=Chloriridovirus anopheles1 TaxID=1465751 RepID=W8QRJ5_9VIRU|nr:BRO-like protein [Anopheles minimus iridovirus]AHL67617.1 BRO-like protein [Anopheles minimus iridovirus]